MLVLVVVIHANRRRKTASWRLELLWILATCMNLFKQNLSTVFSASSKVITNKPFVFTVNNFFSCVSRRLKVIDLAVLNARACKWCLACNRQKQVAGYGLLMVVVTSSIAMPVWHNCWKHWLCSGKGRKILTDAFAYAAVGAPRASLWHNYRTGHLSIDITPVGMVRYGTVLVKMPMLKSDHHVLACG